MVQQNYVYEADKSANFIRTYYNITPMKLFCLFDIAIIYFVEVVFELRK